MGLVSVVMDKRNNMHVRYTVVRRLCAYYKVRCIHNDNKNT